jgi:hypothetical protein
MSVFLIVIAWVLAALVVSILIGAYIRAQESSEYWEEGYASMSQAYTREIDETERFRCRCRELTEAVDKAYDRLFHKGFDETDIDVIRGAIHILLSSRPLPPGEISGTGGSGQSADVHVPVLWPDPAQGMVPESGTIAPWITSPVQSMPGVPSPVGQCAPGPAPWGGSNPRLSTGASGYVESAAGNMPDLWKAPHRHVPRGPQTGGCERREARGGEPPAAPPGVQS